MAVFWQSCCILSQLVVFRAKVVVFRQKWFCSGESACLGAKVVVFGKMVVFGRKWLSSDKSGCTRAQLFYSGKRC